jgi:hypothetical protein
MARDATIVSIPSRDAILNYAPGMGQFFVDNFVGPIHLKLPIGFGTADAAVLCTLPAGIKLKIGTIYWEITTSFTGGSSSAIGISSSDAAYNTKGDLLGGATGDVAATLVSTGRVYKTGTAGAKNVTTAIMVLGSGTTIRYDQITSTFTAGAGFVHIDGSLVD